MFGSFVLAGRSEGATHPPVPPVLADAEVQLIARTDAFVLFTGQSHVRTLALKIHNLTRSGEDPFRAIDCGAEPEVLERELFDTLEKGRVGTLFLHEVGHLSAASQARLRDAIALTSGPSDARRARPRIIASTSEPLLPRVLNGSFDDRLFYLLNVMHFDVRPS